MKTINWETTHKEKNLITKIVKRAHQLHPNQFEHISLMMDVVACHNNDTPLDLKKLLTSDDSTFNHDIFGIVNNICRNTGTIQNCFLPKCSK